MRLLQIDKRVFVDRPVRSFILLRLRIAVLSLTGMANCRPLAQWIVQMPTYLKCTGSENLHSMDWACTHKQLLEQLMGNIRAGPD